MRGFADWTVAFLPTLMLNGRDQFSEVIFNAIKDNEWFAPFKPFLEAHSIEVKRFLSSYGFSFFEEGSPLISEGGALLKPYLEAIFLQFSKELITGFADVDRPGNDFLVKFGMHALKVINTYFTTLNGNVALRGEKMLNLPLEKIMVGVNLQPGITEKSLALRYRAGEKSLEIAKKLMELEKLTESSKLQEIEELITQTDHQLFSLNQQQYPNLSAERRLKKIEEQRIELKKRKKRLEGTQANLRAKALQNADPIRGCQSEIATLKVELADFKEKEAKINTPFYQELVKDLLALRGPAALELPFPPIFAKQLSGLTKTELLPSVMRSLFDLALSPESINKGILATLFSLERMLDTFDAQDAMEAALDKARHGLTTLNIVEGVKEDECVPRDKWVVNEQRNIVYSKRDYRYLTRLVNIADRQIEEVKEALKAPEEFIKLVSDWEVINANEDLQKCLRLALRYLADLQKCVDNTPIGVTFKGLQSTFKSLQEIKDHKGFKANGTVEDSPDTQPLVTQLSEVLTEILSLVRKNETEMKARTRQVQTVVEQDAGRFMENLIKIMPSTLIQALYRAFGVSSSQALGQAISWKLEKGKMVGVVNYLMQLTLPNLCAGGRWEEGRFVRPNSPDDIGPFTTDEVTEFRKVRALQLGKQLEWENSRHITNRGLITAVERGFNALKESLFPKTTKAIIRRDFNKFFDFIWGGYAPQLRIWAERASRKIDSLIDDLRAFLKSISDQCKETDLYQVIAWCINGILGAIKRVLWFIPEVILNLRSANRRLLEMPTLPVHQSLLAQLMSILVHPELLPEVNRNVAHQDFANVLPPNWGSL